MNKPGQDHEEREWRAQERGLRDARDGTGLPPEDGMIAQYRRIAQGLRQPPRAGLPPDFAARVARIAEARMPVAETTFEQRLVRGLAIAFVLSALAALGIYGGRLLSLLQAEVSVEGLQWALVLLACVGLSGSFDWLRWRMRHRQDGGPMRAA